MSRPGQSSQATPPASSKSAHWPPTWDLSMSAFQRFWKMISVLVPTLNERRNIADCLASVRWSTEIVVVDSGSNDGTQELARAAGARVVDFKWNGQFPKKK